MMRILEKFSGVILFVGAIVFLVTGCGNSGQAKAPPPSEYVYIVKHYAADGSVIATHRAKYAHVHEGCVRFSLPGDPSAMAYRVACGTVSVQPEEK